MKKRPAKEIRDAWHDDPANWKLGILYYNKADKRVFVPKKMPILGWTLNFASPFCIIPIVLLILIYMYVKFNH
jgi:uncharacterized membrane protein